ncbi:MAG: aldehyde dehydrogenase family protein [Gammaproteobacteria bacterium PRO9]|nr:aldehyde dehydrogenase family protein [Gammaproteobacteria bacterium PRO9]
MVDYRQFYIDGAWRSPQQPATRVMVNPATGQQVGTLAMGDAVDVDQAVGAARRAFQDWSRSTIAERRELIERVAAICMRRLEDIAQVITAEMGAPLGFSRQAQAPLAVGHFKTMARVLESWPAAEDRKGFRLQREPVGVCGLITPWNWPVNQVACKVAPALAAGCTMVLKPSELAPMSATIFAEILHEAGVPPGVFNLVHGDGAGVGQALATHAGVDMISITGSTRAGIAVAQAAAPTMKRVHQELGGKSPLVILDEATLDAAVRWGVADCFSNSGQSCNAPTRMLVPAALHDRAVALAREVARGIVVGDPCDPATQLGPVVSQGQFDRIQRLIRAGVEEGATLAAGGEGRPDGLTGGYYVRPTVFANVRNDMTIAREEIFGPVLVIIPHDSEEDAVRLANDTAYGLAAYVWGSDLEAARRVAGRIRAGMVHLNGAPMSLGAPFGGFRQSGNGREWGEFGLAEFVELKAILGFSPKAG